MSLKSKIDKIGLTLFPKLYSIDPRIERIDKELESLWYEWDNTLERLHGALWWRHFSDNIDNQLLDVMRIGIPMRPDESEDHYVTRLLAIVAEFRQPSVAARSASNVSPVTQARRNAKNVTDVTQAPLLRYSTTEGANARAFDAPRESNSEWPQRGQSIVSDVITKVTTDVSDVITKDTTDEPFRERRLTRAERSARNRAAWARRKGTYEP